jgi:SulP family sulfate permease
MAASRSRLAGDVWGGLASTLVALPSSIAFGVAVYGVLGPEAAAQGAFAGLVGALALGLVAPIFGGTDRLISAPCAPAAAVMGALAAELLLRGPSDPDHVLALMALVGLLAGALQILFGVVGGGTLIKYIPYPVVTGYLSGVGAVIFLKQLPVLLADPRGLVVGAVTIAGMLVGSRLVTLVPGAILGLAGGLVAYFGLALRWPDLLKLTDNPLVIGPLASGGTSAVRATLSRTALLANVGWADVGAILVPSLTLAALLSIDTLKTCVVVDALTRSRHDSNREMCGQGIANIVSALLGGLPGAGTSGATLVNIASGAQTRRSAVLEGVFVLVAAVALAPLVAWTPVAALAGILVVVAWRMFDWRSFRLLRQRSTVLDFAVVAVVIVVAVGVGLVTASGVGVALAIVLFVRDQVRGSVIHRKTYGNQIFSHQRRLPAEMTVLEQLGSQTVVCELQGNLFFGTTDQLLREIDEDLKTRSHVILDLRRVRTVDYTAVHLLEQIEDRLRERGAELAFSNVPRALPTGQDLRVYFDEVGLVRPTSHIRVFNQLSDALEWAEDELLAAAGFARGGEEEPALDLRAIAFLRDRKEETVRAFAECVEERSYAPGDAVFRQGDLGDEVFFVRRGVVRILLRLSGGGEHHVATVTRGDFFGDMAFLDRGARSADAVASTATDLYVLSRERLDELAARHPRLGLQFFTWLSHVLALRLRHADSEIRALEEA